MEDHLSIFGTMLNYLVRLMNSERGWVWKVAAAGGFGLVIAIRSIAKIWPPNAEELVLSLSVPVYFTAAAVLLCRADAVRSRLRDGKPVGAASRLFLGNGIWSALLCFVLALLVGFPLAIWIGNVL